MACVLSVESSSMTITSIRSFLGILLSNLGKFAASFLAGTITLTAVLFSFILLVIVARYMYIHFPLNMKAKVNTIAMIYDFICYQPFSSSIIASATCIPLILIIRIPAPGFTEPPTKYKFLKYWLFFGNLNPLFFFLFDTTP